MHLLTVVRCLPLVVLLGCPGAVDATDGVAAAARALAKASERLPGEAGIEVRKGALKVVILAEEGRLAPASLPTAEVDALSAIFFPSDADRTARAGAAAKLPPADEVVFDGRRLFGGNFKNIDALIGANRQPIAMDRQLPAFIVPISSEAAEALRIEGDVYRADAEAAMRIDRIHGANVAAYFVAEGIVLRPYAGRIDDLYVHLAQEEPRTRAMDFHAIAESLSGRAYHPVSGLASGKAIPPANFSLNDVLSEGAYSAVQRFRKRSPGRLARNPFSGFALRVVPVMGDALAKTETGSALKISREVVKLAMTSPRRFAPTSAPPLFRDSSRFFGMLRSGVIRVANRNTDSDLSAEIANVEAENALPDDPDDPVANELLEASKETDWLVDAGAISPDPPDFDAEFTEFDVTEPIVEVRPDSPVDEAAAGVGERSPRVPTGALQVAVFTPDATDAEQYLERIAASDATLVTNAAEWNRVECYQRWMRDSLHPIHATLAHENAVDPDVRAELESVVVRVDSELASLREKAIRLHRERLEELTARGALRRELEERVRTERGRRMAELAGATV